LGFFVEYSLVQAPLHTLCGGVAQVVQAACTMCAALPAQLDYRINLVAKSSQSWLEILRETQEMAFHLSFIMHLSSAKQVIIQMLIEI